MSSLGLEERDEAPTLEVRVYRDGALIHRELCESEEDAAAAVERWEEEPGVECEVEDLSASRRDVEVFEVEPPDIEDYTAVTKAGAERRW